MNAEREKFLRQWAGHPTHIEEMWAEIDDLREREAALREALAPLDKWAAATLDMLDRQRELPTWDGYIVARVNDVMLKVRHLREFRAALAATPGEALAEVRREERERCFAALCERCRLNIPAERWGCEEWRHQDGKWSVLCSAGVLREHFRALPAEAAPEGMKLDHSQR